MVGEHLKNESTLCNVSYLTSGLNNLSECSFCSGVTWDNSDGGHPSYSDLSVYACRLYTRCLSATEVEDNFHESVNYHNYLIGRD